MTANIFLNDKTLYKTVYEKILEDASKTNLKIGSKLPSIQKLAKRYNVSESPVRKAVQNLIKNGFAESIRRKGIFLKKIPETLSDQSEVINKDDDNYALPFSASYIKSRVGIHIRLVDTLPKQKKMWEGIITRFKEKHSNIEIFTSHRSEHNPNNPPDIIQLGSRQVIDNILNGNIQPIPFSMFPLKRFPETSLVPAIHEDNLYGIPLNANLPFNLVNTDILQKLSIDLSREHYTFETFINTCDQLYKAQENGLIEKDILPLASQVNPFLYMISFSKSFFDDQKKQFNWNHPSVIEFFRKISVVKRSKEEIGVSWIKLQNRFFNGKALFASSYPLCFDKIPSFANALPFPRNKNGIIMHGTNFHAITAQSEKLIESIKFLQFLTSEEIKDWVNNIGCTHILGSKKKTDNTVEGIETSQLDNSVSDLMCGVKNYDFIVKHFWPVIDHVRETTLSPEEAVDILAKSYSNVYKGESQ